MAKWNKDLENEVLLLAASGLTVIHIAARVGIHRDTIYDRCRKHPSFKEAFEEARRGAAAWLREQVFKDDMTIRRTLKKNDDGELEVVEQEEIIKPFAGERAASYYNQRVAAAKTSDEVEAEVIDEGTADRVLVEWREQRRLASST